MKKIVVLSAFCLSGLCCANGMNFLARSVAPDKPAKPSATRPQFAAPVVASTVTADNAKDKAKALNEELDRDLQAAIERQENEKKQ